MAKQATEEYWSAGFFARLQEKADDFGHWIDALQENNY